jgi:hypothetical protein
MKLSSGNQVAEHLSIGILAQAYPVERIRAALRATDTESERVRDLPAELLVYFGIALGLFMTVSTREVLRCLLEGLRWLHPERLSRVAAKSALSQGRTRLGFAPFQALWEGVALPMAAAGAPGAFFRDWRLLALDGTTFEVPDTAANAERFGRPGVRIGKAAFPQLRMVGLVEVGTHAWLQIAHGPLRLGEQTLAKAIIAHLQPGMLCLADRLFTGFPLWQQAAATGAHLLWRAKRNLNLPVETELPDGSYLSTFYPSTKARKNQEGGLVVRVIEYTLEGGDDDGTVYRLVTTLLDPELAPAEELAKIFPQRWEIEGTFDELKTHLRGKQVVLRSKTPDLVIQELYGLLLAHRAVRHVMHQAARSAALDPDELSFTHAVCVLRRKLAARPVLPP